MRGVAILLALVLAIGCAAVCADPLTVELSALSSNPARPRMGDAMRFRSVIRNTGRVPVHGVLAWLSLVRVDPGHEQPVDLEDWGAQKALTVTRLEPGGSVTAEWPMRLIQAGHYRVLVSVVSRDVPAPSASPSVAVTVRAKPAVASRRVLPVSLGIPLVLAALLLRRWRRRSAARRGQPSATPLRG